jgi:hypothetical protein
MLSEAVGSNLDVHYRNTPHLFSPRDAEVPQHNGTGLWPGLALRLGRLSELTRITLRKATLSKPR